MPEVPENPMFNMKPNALIYGARYDRVMEAFGGRGFFVENPKDLRGALDEAMNVGETRFVEKLKFGVRLGGKKSKGPARGDRESLRLDATGFDDWPPALDFRLLKRGERRRRLTIAWPDVLPNVGEALFHRLVSQRLRSGGIELGDD